MFKDSNLFCTVFRVHFRANICTFQMNKLLFFTLCIKAALRHQSQTFYANNSADFFPNEVANYDMFSFYKKHLLSRELLDCWLQKIFGSEVTFRDVFFFWESSCSSQTAPFHATETAPFLKIQNANETL